MKLSKYLDILHSVPGVSNVKFTQSCSFDGCSNRLTFEHPSSDRKSVATQLKATLQKTYEVYGSWEDDASWTVKMFICSNGRADDLEISGSNKKFGLFVPSFTITCEKAKQYYFKVKPEF